MSRTLHSSRACRFAWLAVALVAFGTSRATAQTEYFDINGSTSGFGITTGQTYDWDANPAGSPNTGEWSTSSTGVVATTAWVPGAFPRLYPAGTPMYTVTVTNTESFAGIFFGTPQTVTLNPIGSGNLQLVSGLQGVFGSSGVNATINVPIAGTGGIEPQNGGSLNFNAVNTYSGGTTFISSGTLIFFNNNSSFGTGPMTLSVAAGGFAPLLATGGATITLANNFTSTVTGTGINFAASASTPVVSTGTWSLGANNLALRNNGVASSPLTLSGAISGSGTITLSANNSGLITFSGPNTDTGTIAIPGPGGTGSGTTKVTLELGAANTISTFSSVNLAGGVLDPGGFTHSMGSTTLVLSASTAGSTIDYEAGPGEIDFANSSAVAWASGTDLNLANWSPATTFLRFGTDSTGLTASQLAEIEFNGGGLGSAQLNSQGYVIAVPEPSSLLLLGAGATGLGWFRRRQQAKK
jgi:hypothetical protein